MTRASKRTPTPVRTAAVRRVLAGELATVIAREHNVTLQTVNDWIHCWRRRVGPWCDLPLEQADSDLGYEVRRDWQGTVLQRREDAASAEETDAQIALRNFLELLHRPPLQSRGPIERAYADLGERPRGLLAPALDQYLRASDLADEARRLRQEAIELAVSEVARLGADDAGSVEPGAARGAA